MPTSVSAIVVPNGSPHAGEAQRCERGEARRLLLRVVAGGVDAEEAEEESVDVGLRHAGPGNVEALEGRGEARAAAAVARTRGGGNEAGGVSRTIS